MTRPRKECPPQFDCRASELPIVLLDYAKELWGQGHTLPAAMVCRAAIERRLYQVCRSQPGCEWVGKNYQLGVLLQILRDRRVVPRRGCSEIRRAWGIASKAVHGNRTPLNAIADLLRRTEAIVLKKYEPLSQGSKNHAN